MAYVTDLNGASGISLAPVRRVFRAIYRALLTAQERRAKRMIADYKNGSLTW